MNYKKLAEQIRNLIKTVDQWKACEPGKRKPTYVKLYSDYVKFSSSCKELRLTKPNKYIDRIERGWADLIEWMKAICQFEDVGEFLVTVEENANGVKILRERFHETYGKILDALNVMCSTPSDGKFLLGTLHCYGLLAQETDRDFSALDLEIHRNACKLLSDFAEQTYNHQLNGIIDNICDNYVDAIEAIDGYRVNKGQAITRARHYGEAEDCITAIEQDIDELLTFYMQHKKNA